MKAEKQVIDWQEQSQRESISLCQEAVLCFGHFDVIHPGHLRYFQFAREHGKSLVVAGEDDDPKEFSVKGAPQFSATDRAQAVAALDLVDHVVLVTPTSLIELIESLNFTAFVLGREFEEDNGGPLEKAIDLARKNNIDVLFTAGEAHYATVSFFDKSQHELEIARWHEFQSVLGTRGINLTHLLQRLTAGDQKRILVVGDVIVDRYVACDPIGLSSEAPAIVVKEIQSRDFIGGAAIVAAHIAALGTKCEIVSVVGDDENAEFISQRMAQYGINAHLSIDNSRPTTFKIRYMVENQKLFRVSHLKEHRLAKDIESAVIRNIENSADKLAVIVVSDFVYGVITSRILSTLVAVSKEFDIPLLGDLQCSSQIGNVGKFKDFELLLPTEREARVALNNQDAGVEQIANNLMDQSRAKRLIVKLGGDGLIAYDRSSVANAQDREHFPALSVNPVDVAGAGDALLAAIATGISRNLSLMEAAAVGCCSAALAVETVGNIPVHIDRVRDFARIRENAVTE
jgi:rfaE bifunctional protein kinase chain/domain